jgi:hypothetical protein
MKRIEVIAKSLPGVTECVVCIEIEYMGHTVEYKRVVNHLLAPPSLTAAA